MHTVLKKCIMIIDNIDTRSVLDIIRELVANCNLYMSQKKNPNTLLLRDIAVYITKMFIVFGAISSSYDSIGFPIEDEAVGANVRSIVTC